MWVPDLAGRSGPKARAIANAIAEAVQAGDLAPGDRLPPHRELAYRLGVSVGTVTRSYAEAQRRGLLSGQVGSGTYVTDRTAPERRFGLAGGGGPSDGIIDLSAALAACELRQEALDRALAAMTAAGVSSDTLEYQSAAGMARHRETGARWMAQAGFAPDPRRVMVTHGAQQAIAIALSALARPGATVLCESLVFPPVINLAGLLGLKLHGLPVDGDGLDPDALDEACRATGARVLYVIPTLQNPTGAIQSVSRRRDIARIARAHELCVIEDDVFARLVDAPPPLATFAPERTWYVTSVSKTIAPGLRVGFLLAPDDQLDPLLLAMRALSWQSTPIAAEIATVLIEDGTAERMIAWHRRESAARAQLAREILGESAAANPNDAPHLWLELSEPWRGRDLAGELLRRGVRVAEGAAFATARGGGAHHVRISLNAPRAREQLAQALRIVADALRSGPYHASWIM
jgi:DNA-binding transcriptional MocR family regulator